MKVRKWYFTVMLWGALSAVLFLGGTVYGQVSPDSKTWDFTVTGAKLGSAVLYFDLSGSIYGYIIVIPAPRNKGGADHISEYGFAPLEGGWQTNGNTGQIVGYLYSDPPGTANGRVRLDITSFWGAISVNGNNQTFTITGQTDDGNIKLTGAQIQSSVNLTGNWTIKKTAPGNIVYTEILSAVPNGFGNLYDLTGYGADLCVFGRATISRGNHFDVALWEYQMPSNAPPGVDPCSIVDLTAAPLNGSAAIGNINFQTERSTVLGGVQTQGSSSPSSKISMQVLCQ